MGVPEAIREVRYLVDAHGAPTDVLVPMSTWKLFLASWKQLSELLEDREDGAILRDWLARRQSGETETISLDQLERELIADGLLPG